MRAGLKNRTYRPHPRGAPRISFGVPPVTLALNCRRISPVMRKHLRMSRMIRVRAYLRRGLTCDDQAHDAHLGRVILIGATSLLSTSRGQRAVFPSAWSNWGLSQRRRVVIRRHQKWRLIERQLTNRATNRTDLECPLLRLTVVSVPKI
jgi:hypothetical protein